MLFYFLFVFYSFFSSDLLFSSPIQQRSHEDILDQANILDDSKRQGLYGPNLQLRLGGGVQSFFGKIQISFTRKSSHIVPGFSLSYFQYDYNKEHSNARRAEIFALYEFRNSSIFVPYSGFGGGFSSWIQKDQNRIYDKLSSLLSFGSFGIEVQFTENFSIILQEKITYFFKRAPYEKTHTENNNQLQKKSIQEELSYKFILKV